MSWTALLKLNRNRQVRPARWAVCGISFRCFLVFCMTVSFVVSIQPEETEVDTARKGKLFSLFSIVTFKNQGCQTNQGVTGSGSVRNGTCYTSTECNDRGGAASGNCAAGFGVCCFFSVDATATISENCSYIRNPGFPSESSAPAAATFTIKKCSTDVCTIRLDFETFSLRGPTLTSEADAAATACLDSFVVKGTSGITSPVICGLNTGHHIYVDMGMASEDTAIATFAFATAVGASRSWEIKVTQVECTAIDRPPPGCLQYHRGLTGRISTFNFDQPTLATQMHLATQDYNICVRQEAGYCCVQYQVCADPQSFTLDSGSTLVNTADIGSACINDFIEIEASGVTSCSTRSGATPTNTRYCGRALHIQVKGAISVAICDCTAPFGVFIHTDDTIDGVIAATIVAGNRGVCLEYNQLPC
jgi:hypothetical protein